MDFFSNTQSYPSVTIINLCYNTGARLRRTLDSIKNQSYKNFELIIVDDASIDDSVIQINNWLNANSTLNARVVVNKSNKGIPATLNTALSHAKGKYLSIIGDDVWDTNFLHYQVSILEKSNSQTALIYSKAGCLDVSSDSYSNELDPMRISKGFGIDNHNELFQKIENELYLMRSPFLRQILLKTNIVVVFTALIKTDFIRKMGGFNEKYFIEDYPLWIKLGEQYDFLFLDKTLGTYMRYGNNYSTDKEANVRISVLRLLIDTYKGSDNKKSLYTLQNRIVTIFLDLYKSTYTNKDWPLLKLLYNESLTFILLPGGAKFFSKKIYNKIFTKRNNTKGNFFLWWGN